MDRITVYITVIIAGDIVIITQKLIILLTKRDFFFLPPFFLMGENGLQMTQVCSLEGEMARLTYITK